jgi:tellurite methyltransferase
VDREIVGFELDERDDWVARLDCGHNQRVRHRLPFFNRPWVVTDEGRRSKLGSVLACVLCDHRELPAGFSCYKETPVFDQDTVPNGLHKDHATKPGVWGLICVREGQLLYTIDREEPVAVTPLASGVLVPNVRHAVRAETLVRFHVAFYRAASR